MRSIAMELPAVPAPTSDPRQEREPLPSSPRAERGAPVTFIRLPSMKQGGERLDRSTSTNISSPRSVDSESYAPTSGSFSPRSTSPSIDLRRDEAGRRASISEGSQLHPPSLAPRAKSIDLGGSRSGVARSAPALYRRDVPNHYDADDDEEDEDEPLPRYAAQVRLSGWGFVLMPDGWRAASSPLQPTHVHAKITFGAPASRSLQVDQDQFKRERVVEASLPDSPRLSSLNRIGDWEAKLNLNTDTLVSNQTLADSPDLAYNIPMRVQLIGRLADGQHSLLAECRHYLDISCERRCSFSFNCSVDWQFTKSLELADLRVEVGNVATYYNEDS